MSVPIQDPPPPGKGHELKVWTWQRQPTAHSLDKRGFSYPLCPHVDGECGPGATLLLPLGGLTLWSPRSLTRSMLQARPKTPSEGSSETGERSKAPMKVTTFCFLFPYLVLNSCCSSITTFASVILLVAGEGSELFELEVSGV